MNRRGMKRQSASLLASLADLSGTGAELCGCPFCGEALAVSQAQRAIFHQLPACKRYAEELARSSNFDDAVRSLAARAVHS